MKIRTRFINYSLQQNLVERSKDEGFPHRIRADGSLESAGKWKDTIYDLCAEISLELFDQPVLKHDVEKIEYEAYIIKLAKHNIPFYSFTIDDEYIIIVSDSDIDYISNNIESPSDMWRKISEEIA